MGEKEIHTVQFRLHLKQSTFRWKLSLWLFFSFYSHAFLSTIAYAENIPIVSFSSHFQIGNENIHTVYDDPSGYTILGTDHGAFFFDGDSFRDLGPKQGLPDGGEVVSIKKTYSGKIVFLYANSLFISNTSLSKKKSPVNLIFTKIDFLSQKDIKKLYNTLQIWGDYVLVPKNGNILSINLLNFRVKKIQFLGKNQKSTSIKKFFDFGYKYKKIYSIMESGDFCESSLESIEENNINLIKDKCLKVVDTSNASLWISASQSLEGDFFIKSFSKVVKIDKTLSKSTEITLKNSNNDPYGIESIAILPNNTIVTPYTNGVYYGNMEKLKEFPIFFDKNNSHFPYIQKSNESDGIWVSKLESGIKYVGNFDQWENIDKTTGIDDDQIWKILPYKDHIIIVSHSGELDASAENPKIISSKYFFDISKCNNGHYYSLSMSDYNVYYKNSDELQFKKLPNYQGKTLTTSDSCATDGSVWVGGQDALIHIDTSHTHTETFPVPGLVDGIATASDGAVWFLENSHLQVFRNGTAHMVVDKWADSNFDPRTLLVDAPDSIWVGGSAGPLHHIHTKDDHVAKIETYSPPTIVSNNVVALLKDNRGWLWVGTDRGVSVFDGHRWTGVTTEDGLVSNDIDQNAMSLAPDGTIWFGTSHGASHLLHPERIFDRAPLNLAIIDAKLGKSAFEGHHDYSKASAEITYGTLNVTNFNSMRFRYRLDGVDPDWVDTRERLARYPLIPPGKHVFRVYAYDPVSRQTSEEIELPIEMAKPWWLTNWAMTAEGLATCLAIYGLFRLWNRHMIARERRLSRLVAERTREIAQAQEALVIQATIDGLTRTLNRGAIQDKLDQALRDGFENAEEALTIGLIDIDHFKQINDIAGHLAGDEVLREFAARLRGHAKPEELVGRYGGEEFLLMMHTTPDQGRARLGRLKTLITGRPFTFNNEAMRVTCSMGVAHARPGDTWQTLIARADAALYAAKKAGRDRVIDSDLDLASSGVGLRRARRRYRDAQL